MKKAFSLIELMISLIIISCICTAFTPVISKRLSASRNLNTTNKIELPELESLGDKKTMLEAMRDCRLNKDKTRLICEVELSDLKSAPKNKSNSNSSVNVNYAGRRDKIRFDNKEEGNYHVSTIVQNDTQNKETVQIPVKDSTEDVDETINTDTIESINELLKLLEAQEINNK